MAKKKGSKLKKKKQTANQPNRNKIIKKNIRKVKQYRAMVPAALALTDPGREFASISGMNGHWAVSQAEEKNLQLLNLPVVPSTHPLIEHAQAVMPAPTSNVDSAVSQPKETQSECPNNLPGFIFMCNGRTKPECYRFRVFGLPASRKDDVEKVKPGTKLFLFDIDLKFLYGVYEATTTGKMNLEPAAFGGKYPAQVKFKIFKECFPLPEKAFKYSIRENYQGPKFKQELSEQMVKNLLSIFPPLSAVSLVPVPHAFPDAAPDKATAPAVVEGQVQYSSTMFPSQNPTLGGRQRDQALLSMEPQLVEHEKFPHRPAFSHPYNVGDPHTSFITGHTQVMQEPYSSYRIPHEVTANDPYMVSDPGYQQVSGPTVRGTVPITNVFSAHRPYIMPGYHQIPLQTAREAVPHQNGIAAYNYYSVPAPPHYVPSAVQSQAPILTRPEANVPVTAYYSFPGATRVAR